MRVVRAIALLSLSACYDITAADSAAVEVVLSPRIGSAVCVDADPEPASVRVRQGISFTNETAGTVTIVMLEDNLPLVTVEAGETSRPVQFNSAGIRYYYVQACGSGSADRHTLSVTIN